MPIECLHPSITGHVFLQLEDVPGQFPFYGPVEELPEVYLCQGVYDKAHSPPLSVRIEFHTNGDRYGFWGIGIPDGYDASQFSEICFWAYAEQPNQAFWFKMRDVGDVERGVQVNVEHAGEWEQICTDLSEISDLGVRLDRLENINLGFDRETSDATVWVDDFELR